MPPVDQQDQTPTEPQTQPQKEPAPTNPAPNPTPAPAPEPKAEPAPKSISALPDDAQKYIKELREENKTRRQDFDKLQEDFGKVKDGLRQALGIEEEAKTSDPTEIIQSLVDRTESLELENVLISLAHEHNIPQDKMNYFKYLMNQALASLPEGEELPQEAYGKIIQEVQSVSQGGAGVTSSVGAGTNQASGPNVGHEGPTYDDFKRMNVVERQKLYDTNKNLYDQYKATAIEKGEFIL